ncbi:sigma-E factor negative regulatory protein [Salinispirillum marinum]|uniref:Sigma-E factor negative regulatory protein n=2 Tax=Saccharospirillaceae TaxID=255527 RepID=A0ABV8BG05_9GAMM
MNKEPKFEQLSAWMDDELDELRLHRLLEQAKTDPSVLEDWAQMHQSAAARRGLPVVDVLARVNATLDQQEADEQEMRRQRRVQWQYERRGMVWGALAASVVLSVVTVIWRPVGTPASTPDTVIASVVDASVDPRVAAQLHAYWNVHAQYATYQPGMRWEEMPSTLPSKMDQL